MLLSAQNILLAFRIGRQLFRTPVVSENSFTGAGAMRRSKFLRVVLVFSIVFAMVLLILPLLSPITVEQQLPTSPAMCRQRMGLLISV